MCFIVLPGGRLGLTKDVWWEGIFVSRTSILQFHFNHDYTAKGFVRIKIWPKGCLVLSDVRKHSFFLGVRMWHCQYQHCYSRQSAKSELTILAFHITRNMGQDGCRHAHIAPIWRPNLTINYIGVYKNIKFSPTLCKYFIVAELDNSSDVYKQYLYTKIANISPRLGGSRDRCIFSANSMHSIV